MAAITSSGTKLLVAARLAPCLLPFLQSACPLPPSKPSTIARHRLPSRDARSHRRTADLRTRRRLSGGSDPPEPLMDGEEATFDRAVFLFNGGDYHQCHDVLEELWYGAEEPVRTLLHGVLQCAVGFHHLFNQNHRGAMLELGEGVCKLRKLGPKAGPMHQFEKEVSAALEFVYHTQKELAACTEELCLAMDGSEMSYQLLGSFASGQPLYSLDVDGDGISYIVFSAANHYSSENPSRIKIPTINATEEHLKAFKYK